MFLEQIFWNAGCQLVALNYQSLGKLPFTPVLQQPSPSENNGLSTVCSLTVDTLIQGHMICPRRLFDCLGFNIGLQAVEHSAFQFIGCVDKCLES